MDRNVGWYSNRNVWVQTASHVPVPARHWQLDTLWVKSASCLPHIKQVVLHHAGQLLAAHLSCIKTVRQLQIIGHEAMQTHAWWQLFP